VLGVLDAAAWPAAGARPAGVAATPADGGGSEGGTGDVDGRDHGSEIAEIERLVAEREAARKRRDFAAADRLRGELAVRGIVVEDTPHGARWKRRQEQ
jgi:cysteinyl-tRNA synthetase